MKTITTTSEKQTVNLGKKFAKQIKRGLAIGLVGELGAGKTQFVKGMALGLGIKNNITSPTFVLLKTYGRQLSAHGCQLIHVDCYRLNNSQELLDLGWEEFVNNPQNIVVVEWADKIKTIMPKKAQWVYFKTLKQKNSREIMF